MTTMCRAIDHMNRFFTRNFWHHKTDNFSASSTVKRCLRPGDIIQQLRVSCRSHKGKFVLF
ncbi:Uncharacterised protein [Shigella sonnei]|nr:Uncharacterised protein [Shigella sonnei]